MNILVASIGTLLFVGLYGDMGATISTVVVTVVVLIFGEITPKSVAKGCAGTLCHGQRPLYSPVDLGADAGEFLSFPSGKKFISPFFKTDENAKKCPTEELLLFMEKH